MLDKIATPSHILLNCTENSIPKSSFINKNCLYMVATKIVRWKINAK